MRFSIFINISIEAIILGLLDLDPKRIILIILYVILEAVLLLS